MPEGDTVWLAGQHLHQALAGAALRRGELRVPQLAAVDLTGRTVSGVFPRGKHLLVRLADGWTLHSHLRMDGSWHVYRPGARWRGGSTHEIRAVLATEEWECVGYRLHDLALVRSDDEHRLVGHLGPDVLGPDWELTEALRRLRDRPDEQIGVALLDQRNLAGIGNLYAVEVLFLSGVHPWSRVGEVPDLPGLVERARTLMRANLDHPAQSTTGDLRRGRQHWVYGRADRSCRRCGTPIVRSGQHGRPQERVAFWCPRCQPAPARIAPG